MEWTKNRHIYYSTRSGMRMYTKEQDSDPMRSLIAPRHLRTTMNYSTIFKRRISTICGKVRKRLPDWPANVYILIMFIHSRTRM